MNGENKVGYSFICTLFRMWSKECKRWQCSVWKQWKGKRIATRRRWRMNAVCKSSVENWIFGNLVSEGRKKKERRKVRGECCTFETFWHYSIQQRGTRTQENSPFHFCLFFFRWLTPWRTFKRTPWWRWSSMLRDWARTTSKSGLINSPFTRIKRPHSAISAAKCSSECSSRSVRARP